MQVEIQRQLTVVLENYPGRLAAVTTVLDRHHINIKALSLIDTIEQGVIRLIASDPSHCKSLLTAAGFYVIEANVLSVELTNIPGQLLLLTTTLAEAKINLEYIYGSATTASDKINLILKVSDLNQAHAILAASEVN
jgi:hypothetical protein